MPVIGHTKIDKMGSLALVIKKKPGLSSLPMVGGGLLPTVFRKKRRAGNYKTYTNYY
jgi:hypothetical protein